MDEPRPTPPPERVVLLGMMGSGKTSVGLALSERTGWPFIDNDALVARATGMSARVLLAERGEAAMREAESAALREGLAITPPVIVATAAGTVLRAEDRHAIGGSGVVVWLNAPADVLASRAAGAEHRPWLDDDPVGWFERTLAERDELYRAIADIAIDTSVVRPAEAAEQVIEALPASR